MPIRFFSEGIDFKINNQKKIKRWVALSARKENKNIGDINYVFCSDDYLLHLNQRFLNHNTFTDIITFDGLDSSDTIGGEIYISVDRVNDNAIKYKNNPKDELLRVIIHGVLHLCGYRDKKPSEVILMRKKEDTYLSLWQNSFT